MMTFPLIPFVFNLRKSVPWFFSTWLCHVYNLTVADLELLSKTGHMNFVCRKSKSLSCWVTMAVGGSHEKAEQSQVCFLLFSGIDSLRLWPCWVGRGLPSSSPNSIWGQSVSAHSKDHHVTPDGNTNLDSVWPLKAAILCWFCTIKTTRKDCH